MLRYPVCTRKKNNECDKLEVEVQKALDQTQLLFDSLMQQYFG